MLSVRNNNLYLVEVLTTICKTFSVVDYRNLSHITNYRYVLCMDISGDNLKRLVASWVCT